MKKFLFVVLFFLQYNLFSQTGIDCSSPLQFCSNILYDFPLSVDNGSGQVGPNYSCLGSQPNPTWFYLLVNQPGEIDIHIQSTPGLHDVDFTCWGPFYNLASCGNLTATNTVDCSYSSSYQEDCNIINAQTGKYYIFMITNYSNSSTNVNLQQTNSGVGAGSSVCGDLICYLDSIDAVSTFCTQPNNQFAINGNLYFSTLPDSGSITITDQASGVSQIFNYPFTNPFNFTLNNIPYLSQTGTINACLNGNPNCLVSVNYNPPLLVTLNTSIANPNCGSSDGAIVVNVASNGIPNYSYQWSSGQSINNTPNSTSFINLIPSGVYIVTVTNGNGCTTSSTVNLNNNISFSATINQTNIITCNGNCNGSVAVNVSGSNLNPPFNYIWSNGALHVGDTLTTDTLNGLCVGLISITVTDNNGCDVVSSLLVASQSPIYSIISNVINPSCAYASDGAATVVSVINGIPPFTYIWNTTPNQYTQTANNLSAGNYSVTVSDSIGCFDIENVTLINPLPPQANFNFVSNELSVNFINMSSAGTYNWNFGDGYGSSLVSPTYTYTSSGTYTVCLTVTDQCATTTVCHNVTVSLVGIEGEILENINIYPNPASSNINIYFSELMESSIELFDNIGQKVAEYKFKSKSNVVYLNKFNEGMYYIKIKTDKGTTSRKIIINKN